MIVIIFKAIFLTIITNSCNSKNEIKNSVKPPNIKTIVFKNENNSNQFPILEEGNFINLSFDDLNGSEADYYYKITYHNFDWSNSILVQNEYLEGFVMY